MVCGQAPAGPWIDYIARTDPALAPSVIQILAALDLSEVVTIQFEPGASVVQVTFPWDQIHRDPWCAQGSRQHWLRPERLPGVRAERDLARRLARRDWCAAVRTTGSAEDEGDEHSDLLGGRVELHAT